jgi:deoxyhypusine monooxygenase
VPYLKAVLQDRDEDTMCRHEAAEALGALGDAESLGMLRQFRDDKKEKVVVRETCEIAVAKLEWEQLNEEKSYKRHVIVADLNNSYIVLTEFQCLCFS